MPARILLTTPYGNGSFSPSEILKGNSHFGQPGPYFFICFYLNECRHCQFFAIGPVESEGPSKF